MHHPYRCCVDLSRAISRRLSRHFLFLPRFREKINSADSSLSYALENSDDFLRSFQNFFDYVCYVLIKFKKQSKAALVKV